MITYQVKENSVDVSVVIRIVDSADGTPETGVVFNTTGIALEYRREGAASTAITEATLAALTTAHTDGGFLHIGNGYYRLDLPDAAVASGAAGVLIHGTVTGMVVIGCYIQIVANTAADVYSRIGANGASLSAIPWNAAWDAEVQSEVEDGLVAHNLDHLVGNATGIPAIVSGTYVDQMTRKAAGTFNRETHSLEAIVADAPTAEQIVDLMWNELTSEGRTAGSFGQLLKDNLNATVSSRASQSSLDVVDDFLDSEIAAILAAVDTEVGTILTNVAAILADTGTDGVVLSAATMNALADAFLDRNMATGVDSGSPTVRTPRQALRALRNRTAIAAGTLSVYKENDSDVSWTAVVTTTAGNPITEIDPANA